MGLREATSILKVMIAEQERTYKVCKLIKANTLAIDICFYLQSLLVIYTSRIYILDNDTSRGSQESSGIRFK